MGIEPIVRSTGIDHDDATYHRTREVFKQAEAEAEEFAARTAPEHRAAIARQLGRGTGAAYLAIRGAAEPMLADRTLDGDIRNVRQLVEYSTAASGSSLIQEVEGGLASKLGHIAPLRLDGEAR